MISDPLLRLVVTVLFALAAAECLYSLVSHRMRWHGTIGHTLHLVMSIAMLLMAWPFSMSWPTRPPMWFFVAATVFFVIVASMVATDPATRIADGYHAVMMAAMAWMYAIMTPGLLPGTGSHTMALAMGGDMVLAHSHGDMDMHMDASPAKPEWITAVNWLMIVGFFVAAAVWLYIYFARRRASEKPAAMLTHAGELCQVFMAAGMAIMFLPTV